MSKVAIELEDGGGAGSSLAELVDKAAHGDEVVITRGGEAVAEVIAHHEANGDGRTLSVSLPPHLDHALGIAANALGVGEHVLALRALEKYLAGSGIRPPRITDPDEVAAITAAAAGMWKDRTDLPDLRELRAEWERRFDRVFPGHE